VKFIATSGNVIVPGGGGKVGGDRSYACDGESAFFSRERKNCGEVNAPRGRVQTCKHEKGWCRFRGTVKSPVFEKGRGGGGGRSLQREKL